MIKKKYYYFFFLLINFLGSAVAYEKIGGLCADINILLENSCQASNHDKAISSKFNEFINVIVQNKNDLGIKDWDTINCLIQRYVKYEIRLGNYHDAITVIKRILNLKIPYKVHYDLSKLLQKLNPDSLQIRDLVGRLESQQDLTDSLEDKLIIDIYKLILQSNYSSSKNEVLENILYGKYSNAIEICHSLKQAIDQGICSPAQPILDIEKAFLDKTLIASQILLLNSNQEWDIDLVNKYHDAECIYLNAVDKLIIEISNGHMSRSKDIDNILFTHAINLLSEQPSKGIQELEVIIDHGKYLDEGITCYSYFLLLQIYKKQCDVDSLERLLRCGEKFFHEGHSYFHEYRYFIAVHAYLTNQLDYAYDIFYQLTSYSQTLGTLSADILEFLGCLELRKQDSLEGIQKIDNCHKAANYFLQAYKNWSREDAAIGLFLSWALLGKEEQCLEFLSKYGQNFSLEHKDKLSSIYELFFEKQWNIVSSGGARKDRHVRSLLYTLRNHINISEDKIYDTIILDLWRHYNYSDSRNYLDNTVSFVLKSEETKRFKQLRADGLKSEALDLFLDIRDNVVETPVVYDRSKYSMVMAIYLALDKQDSFYINMLPDFFNEEIAISQSYLRLIWSKCKNRDIKSKDYPLYQRNADIRLYGDKIYFLAYSWEDYLSGNKESLDHLAKFIDLFPYSHLTPLIYYLLGKNEEVLAKKIVKYNIALNEFGSLSAPIDEARSWSYFYYLIKIELAEVLFHTQDYMKSITLFESIKEDWCTENHPKVAFFIQDACKHSLQTRWESGLIKGYYYLNQSEFLYKHVAKNIESHFLRVCQHGQNFQSVIANADLIAFSYEDY